MTDDDQELQRQAEDRLVHALLLHLQSAAQSAHRDRRVAAVLQHIAAASPSVISPARKAPLGTAWARRGVAAAAAALLVAIGLYVFLIGPAPAQASLREILEALSSSGDRAFAVRVTPLDADPVGRPGLDGAMLYSRDGTQYVLVRRDPKGGDLLDGFDGEQSWRIHRGELLESRDGRGAGGLPMPSLMENVSLGDLPQVLRRLREEYSIERFDRDRLPDGDGQDLHHVLARRKSRDVKGAETIEIWADMQTGMPHRIVFGHAKFQGSAEPRELEFRLLSEASLPVDWFSPQPHLDMTSRRRAP